MKLILVHSSPLSTLSQALASPMWGQGAEILCGSLTTVGAVSQTNTLSGMLVPLCGRRQRLVAHVVSLEVAVKLLTT